ncbi:hypothetical protein NSS71_07965 [Niallia sp. FSL W8-0951]|uniref:hypothetical protein n=1 Tax=Niallia sp. FSL W8-0951 TaxID=2954639 RepID=UPI0030FA4750
MDKNLELSTKVLEKVENELINKNFKSVKLLLQGYRKQIDNSTSLRSFTEFNFADLKVTDMHHKKLIELILKAQELLEEMLDADDYLSINALTLIIGDLQFAKHSMDFSSNRSACTSLKMQTTEDYDVDKGRPIE